MGSGLCARLWAILAVGVGAASFWILDASDAPKPRTCQTVGSGLCETVGGVAQAVGSGLWRAKSFFSSGPKLPFKRLKPLKPLKPLKRFDTCQWLCHTSGFWTLQTLHGCFRRSKTSHLLDCGLWALRESDAPKPRTCQTVGSGLCETVGGVAQAVGSGRWRAGAASLWILDASDAPKPRTCQTVGSGLCETVGGVAQAVGSGRWRAGAASLWILDASDAPKPRTCQTVGSGLCETVGGVAQAVGSGLWRAKSFFSSGPKLPFKRLKPLKPLKPLKRSDTCQWLCHTSGFWTLQTLHGCFRRSKTSHLLDCGLWALRESDAPKPRTCQTVGSGLCETVGGVAQAVGSSGLCETVGGVAQAVGSGRWRAGAASLWILDASDAPKPRTCQTVGSGLCETVGGVAQAVGSGLWRAKSFFSSGPKLPFKRLKPLKPLKRSDTCQWLCHTSGFWTLQTLHGCFRRSKTSHLLDCGLWALRESDAPKPRTCQTVGSGLCETVGGVAQAVGSGLWRAKSFFSSGPKLPFKRLKPLKPLKPLKRSDTCQWLCQARRSSQPLDSGCFRRSKTSRLPDCGLWALRDCGRSCAGCGLGALARQILFFLVARNCPSNASNPSNPSNPSNAPTLASAIRLDPGRFRRSMDASDAPKPRTC